MLSHFLPSNWPGSSMSQSLAHPRVGNQGRQKSANTKVIHRQQPAGGEGLVTRLLVPLHLRKLMQACEQIVY